MKKLKIAKRLVLGDESQSFQLFTINNTTGEKGVATFCLDEKNIKVYEGNGNGSNDKEMDYKTFIENYFFYVAHDLEQIPVLITEGKKITDINI